MNNQKFRTTIINRFFDFAKLQGFSQGVVKEHSLSTEAYAFGTHALGITIDWRDSYLDMFVIRLVDGKLPVGGYATTPDGRLCRIPIRHIYDVELPAHFEEMTNLFEKVACSLDFLISVVQNDSTILKEYIANINIHTTVENTIQYHKQSMQRILDQLDRDYQDGRMDTKTYELFRKQARLQLNG